MPLELRTRLEDLLLHPSMLSSKEFSPPSSVMLNSEIFVPVTE